MFTNSDVASNRARRTAEADCLIGTPSNHDACIVEFDSTRRCKGAERGRVGHGLLNRRRIR